jgi:hypothetical protein
MHLDMYLSRARLYLSKCLSRARLHLGMYLDMYLSMEVPSCGAHQPCSHCRVLVIFGHLLLQSTALSRGRR